MRSTNRFACEESLSAKLGGYYERLCPQARSPLLQCEQIYRIADPQDPSSMVFQCCKAFECQMRVLLRDLDGYLRHHGLSTHALDQIWRRRDPGRTTLGDAGRILGHDEAKIGEFFELAGLDRRLIREALEEVRQHRNDAAHPGEMSPGTARALLDDWFKWRGLPGGIFSVFFRNERAAWGA